MSDMRKTVILTIMALWANLAFGQGLVPSKQDINSFFHTKTLVVLQDNPLLEYNMVIKQVMKQEWKVTKYDFISYEQFKQMRNNPQYSFLYMSDVTFDKDKTDAQYRFLFLSLGGDYARMNQMPDLASIPLAYYNVDEDNYIYKLAILVRFIQNHVKLIHEHPEIVSSNVLQYYNDNMKEIKGKTLYLLQDELAPDVNSTARIKKIYPYKFKIVTKDEITQAIKDRDPNVVFLHKVGPDGTKINARCYNIIIGAADAKFYYFNYHKISNKKPDGFLASDFKKLAKR